MRESKARSPLAAQKEGNVFTHKARKVGRPRSQYKELGTIQTRAPAQTLRYCQIIRTMKFDSLMHMFSVMLKEFGKEKPWENGLKWRKPQSAKTLMKDTARMTGWVPVNINIEASDKEEIANRCLVLGVSMATYCYTAIYWWVQYVYPHR